MNNSSILSGGFSDPVFQSQETFRAVLDAFARPGTIQPVPAVVSPPPGLHPAAAALIAALGDHDTPVWLDRSLASGNAGKWIAFQTGAPLAESAGQAAFALIGDAAALSSPDMFALGSEEYPDRSTTVVIQVEGFEGSVALTLEGPGIKGERNVRPDPLPAVLAGFADANRALYPRGVDLVLAASDALVALPRSVRVRVA